MVSFCLACFHAKPENTSSLCIGIGVSLTLPLTVLPGTSHPAFLYLILLTCEMMVITVINLVN